MWTEFLDKPGGAATQEGEQAPPRPGRGLWNDVLRQQDSRVSGSVAGRNSAKAAVLLRRSVALLPPSRVRDCLQSHDRPAATRPRVEDPPWRDAGTALLPTSSARSLWQPRRARHARRHSGRRCLTRSWLGDQPAAWPTQRSAESATRVAARLPGAAQRSAARSQEGFGLPSSGDKRPRTIRGQPRQNRPATGRAVATWRPRRNSGWPGTAATTSSRTCSWAWWWSRQYQSAADPAPPGDKPGASVRSNVVDLVGAGPDDGRVVPPISSDVWPPPTAVSWPIRVFVVDTMYLAREAWFLAHNPLLRSRRRRDAQGYPLDWRPARSLRGSRDLASSTLKAGAARATSP